MHRLSSLLAILVLVAAVLPASAVADETQFFAQLVAGSPWKGTWEGTRGWGKGTWELLFSLENGRLKARTQNIVGCAACQEGDAEILQTSKRMVTLRTATTTFELALGKDGTLAGEGLVVQRWGVRTLFAPSTK